MLQLIFVVMGKNVQGRFLSSKPMEVVFTVRQHKSGPEGNSYVHVSHCEIATG